MVNIALIGCGRIGQMHAANIAKHQLTNLTMVFDADEESARKVAQLYGVKIGKTSAEIFDSENIDGVLIASATSTHADFIEKAVFAGKPVLCEKPIDLDLGRVNQCAKQISGTSIPIQIGFNRRYDPGHSGAKTPFSVWWIPQTTYERLCLIFSIDHWTNYTIGTSIQGFHNIRRMIPRHPNHGYYT